MYELLEILWYVDYCVQLLSCTLFNVHTPLVLNTDFSANDPVATFAVGAPAPGCIQVDISPDTSVEGDHTFSVSLNPGPIIPSLTVGTPSTTVVTITDDANDSKWYVLTVSVVIAVIV